MARFYSDPLGFVMYAYPWDTDPSLQLVKLAEPWSLAYGCEYGPDAWACAFLDKLGQLVRERGFDGVHAVDPIRMAIASGHGIGKSALVAWIVDWIMSTRPNAQGTVTATTAPQLRTKTWAQIARWTKKCVTGRWFDVSTGLGSMRMEHKAHPDEWFCQAQTCAEENSEAFAGQHAASSTSFYLFDEASGVPDKIDEVSEGGLTDGEPMKFAFGNPTQNTGWFHGTFHGQRHRWNQRQVDSRTVSITNKHILQEWIEDYGIDSDFVKIRVRGMFPSMSAKQFISVADIDAAFGRHLRKEQYVFAPKVLTLDNSWEGDDEGVIALRQGLRYEVLRVFPKNDNDIEIANILANLEDEHEADGVIIDAGYGTGVKSAGDTMGREWQIVWASGASPDPGCLNMRAYMAKQVRDWLKRGGAIDGRDNALYNELVEIHTVPRMDGKLQIEAKKDAKRRGLPSPNRFDALGLSLAIPVGAKNRAALPTPAAGVRRREYNPLEPSGRLEGSNGGHDPFASM